jgi:hypothetical protein
MVAKGGVSDQSLVGLVKQTAPGIRPSLLGQTDFCCFKLDFRAACLTLACYTLLPPLADTVPLVDLRSMGAPSQQYVARVKSLLVNGQLVRSGLPIYAMIDSGSTGLYMTESLFYPLQRESRGFRSCTVEFETGSGSLTSLTASRASPLFLCFPTRFPWFDEQAGYLLVVGMAFLDDAAVTIDMDRSEMLVEL